MNKAIIYVRVSTREQAEEGMSLYTQEKACREYAAKRGIQVDRVFVEEGESAKTIHRTQLKELLAYCADHRKEIDSLILFKINRLSRKTQDYLALKSVITGFGISIHYVTENYEDNPVGRLMETVVASIAQFDNEQRAEVSKNGMLEAVKLGRWVWKAPTGYENTRVQGSKNIAPRQDIRQVQLIKRTWELIDNGLHPEQARKIVTEEGLRNNNGKPLSKSGFYKMLNNPLYKGTVHAFGLKIISDSITPIVPQELYDRVDMKLHGKNKSTRKYSKANPLFPLRNILKCTEGHNMTGSAPRGNGGRYPKYHCAYCRGKGTSHSKDSVEARFRELIDQFEYQSELKDALIEAVKANWEFRLSTTKQLTNKLEREILELKARDDLITDKNLKGVYSDEKTKGMLANIQLEITKRQLEINDYKELDEDLEEIVEYGFSSLERIGNVWESMQDIEVKQRFQSWLFPAGLQYDGVEFGTTALPLCVSIKKDFSEEKSLMVIPRGIEPLLPG
jgi:site-specific DNA recombinase